MHENLKPIPWPSAPALPGQVSLPQSSPTFSWTVVLLVIAAGIFLWWYLKKQKSQVQVAKFE
jgi:hypothetical protein